MLSLGVVIHIDFIPKKGKNGSKYNAVYIHFSKWFDNVATANFQENVLNPLKDAKLVYDEPWFWYVLPNTVPTAKSNLDPLAPEWIPKSSVPFTPSSGFPFKQVESVPFDGKAWLKNIGLLEFLNVPKKKEEEVLEGEIQDSKFARDTANKEIADLREEVKRLQKQLLDEKVAFELLRESYFEPNYLELESEFEKYKQMMEEENGKLQYQLDEKDMELMYNINENHYLTADVKNLKDELQATYSDNDVLEEDNNRMSSVIIELKKQLKSQEK